MGGGVPQLVVDQPAAVLQEPGHAVPQEGAPLAVPGDAAGGEQLVQLQDDFGAEARVPAQLVRPLVQVVSLLEQQEGLLGEAGQVHHREIFLEMDPLPHLGGGELELLQPPVHRKGGGDGQENLFLMPDGGVEQAGVGRLHAQAQVDGAGLEAGVQVGGVHLQQAGPPGGVLTLKLLRDIGQHMGAEEGGRPHPDAPLALPGQGVEVGLHLLPDVQDALDRVDVVGPRRRQADGVGAAVEDGGVDLRLRPAHRRAQGGLGQIELPGGLGEALLLIHRVDIFHLFEHQHGGTPLLVFFILPRILKKVTGRSFGGINILITRDKEMGIGRDRLSVV